MIFYDRDEEIQVLEAMRSFKLRPGQALWLGPRSVAILAGRELHKGGKLPDRLVLEESEWRAT